MKITHKATIHAECPHGGWDYYDLEFTFNYLIEVEDINEELDRHRGTKAFQEEIAQEIFDRLTPHRLVCKGRHGNFDTEVLILNFEEGAEE